VNKKFDPVSEYLQKRGLSSKFAYKNFTTEKSVVVVVPCFDEMATLPNLIHSLMLTKLDNYHQVGFVFVVNHPEDTSPERKESSLKTFLYLEEIGRKGALPIAIIDLFSPGYEVPSKFSGAGFPRKIGMDSSLILFGTNRLANCLLVCLDADCEVSSNYLEVLLALSLKGCKAAVLEYQHRNNIPENKTAIDEYESYLRSYSAGLKYAGSPYSYHFIGSTMVCNAETYIKAGGMNTKRAGEDFYFLEKLAKNTPIETIEPSMVFPSNRGSDRVIFGTGKAINLRIETQKQIIPYPVKVFEKLKDFLEVYREEYKNCDELIEALQNYDPQTFEFLQSYKFSTVIEKLYNGSKSNAQLLKQKDIWFDALKTLKFVRHFSNKFDDENC
jgi:hypothetical protein